MSDTTKQMIYNFLQGQGKLWGMSLATFLVSHHVMSSDYLGAFADLFVAGLIYVCVTGWSWWNSRGHALLAARIKKLTGQDNVVDAGKVADALPSTPPPSVQAVAAAVVKVALWLFVLIFMSPVGAHAQIKSPQQVISDIKAQNSKPASPFVAATGDPVADLHAAVKKGGAKLILHLKQSYAMASTKGINGTSDNTSATCSKALVPIFDLIVNGPKAGAVPADDPMALTAEETAAAADVSEPEGVIVQVEKLRILRLALQSPALNDACGALVQDEVKNAQNIVGKITSLVTGAGIAGLTGGLVP